LRKVVNDSEGTIPVEAQLFKGIPEKNASCADSK
jgi:hypothetical protein